MTTPSSSSVPGTPAVFYDVDADRIYVESAPALQPWDTGRVRLTHVLRDDNGSVDGHVLDLAPDAARELADAILCAAHAVDPVATAVQGPRQGAFPVWREGDRIRNAAGEGYSDGVSETQILGHARASLDAGHYRDAAFEVAVLSLRQQERAS